MDEPRMASLLVSHKRPGFYFRVLEEGEVGSGDVIERVAEGPERLTIAEADALLYLPGHPRAQLDRALRIPALSPGWKQSFRALSSAEPDTLKMGNPGRANVAGKEPAWKGFRPLQVNRVDRESASILSFSFEDPHGKPLPPALPGQFLVLKIQPGPADPPLLRNYSLSGKPGAGTYRISVKREAKGAASSFLHNHVSSRRSRERECAPRAVHTSAWGTACRSCERRCWRDTVTIHAVLTCKHDDLQSSLVAIRRSRS